MDKVIYHNADLSSVFDYGANERQFARYICGKFPDAELYCFEPLPVEYEKLKKWAEIKNNKVKCYDLALGDFEGEVEMLYHTEHSPSSSILKTTKVCESLYPFTKSQ